MSARKKTFPNRRRSGTALVLVMASLCALGILAFREAQDPRFALGAIDVSGARNTRTSDIILAAALPKGSNVWLLDAASARRRVEALPWIATATIGRTWPNRVSISVTERTAVAAVLLPYGGSGEEPAAQVALIDASTRVLTIAAGVAGAANLPLFRIEPQPTALEPGVPASGDDVQHAYDAMVQLRALGLRVSEIDLKPSTGVTVTCDGGLRVILGSDDELAKKVSLYKAIAPNISSPQRVVYVDLRSVRAPTVLYR